MSLNTTEVIVKKFNDAQDRLVLQSSDLSLESLSNMVAKKSIDIKPKYQRRERWSTDQQSALIESFLLNIPIPPVYLSEEQFGVYSVIDGKQRLTAIHKFINNELRLAGLQNFHELNGFYFSDLPEEPRNALEVRPYLRVVTLLRQTDPELKYEVFTRLNKGGEPLNPQEIRNVVFRGELNDRIVNLANNTFLRGQLKIRNEKSKAFQKMKDIEFVLRFLTLTETWNDFRGDYKDSMDRFMAIHTPCSQEQIEIFADTFTRSIKYCQLIWGNAAFKRPSTSNGWRDQALAGMYDAQMIAVSSLGDKILDEAVDNKEDVITSTRVAFDDTKFDSAVRTATNNSANVTYRIEKITDILAGDY